MDKTEEVYVPQEVADKMRLDVQTIYAKAKRGEIPGAFYSGATLRVNKEKFDNWFYQREKKPSKKA